MSTINELIERQAAFEEGYAAGKRAILDEIDDILDRCARDNGEMIVRALNELKIKIIEKNCEI